MPKVICSHTENSPEDKADYIGPPDLDQVMPETVFGFWPSVIVLTIIKVSKMLYISRNKNPFNSKIW